MSDCSGWYLRGRNLVASAPQSGQAFADADARAVSPSS